MAKRRSHRNPALSDWHLWSEVTRSVSPLPGRPVRVIPPVGESHDLSDNPPLQAAKTGGVKSTRIPGDGGALFRNAPRSASAPAFHPGAHARPKHKQFGPDPSGIEPRLHRKLRRGQMPIDGTIDLHGMHQPQARAALHRFILARLEQGDRTILVITGKGLKKSGHGQISEQGVLRHMLPVWLSEPALSPYIAGWQVSAQQHGGEGAYYVRLKAPAR